MFDSLLDGLFVLTLGWTAAAIFFFLGIKDMSISLARKLAILLALATPFMAYHVSAEQYLYQVTTLHDDILEGSLDAVPGLPASVRVAVFNVDNPGVEHSFSVSPLRSSENAFPAHVMGKIMGPDLTLLLNFDDTFETVNVHHGSRIKHTTKEWREKIFSFTPTRSGEHHIELIPVTVGIPKLSFRISDPTKKDGRVLAGLLSKKLFYPFTTRVPAPRAPCAHCSNES